MVFSTFTSVPILYKLFLNVTSLKHEQSLFHCFIFQDLLFEFQASAEALNDTTIDERGNRESQT